METGKYLLTFARPETYIIDMWKLQGEAPCSSYPTLEAAKAAKERMEREFNYEVKIVQIVG